MLFDLKGKRRRTVQGVYLLLAVLMGGGLVLFGIGSSTNGGLLDSLKGGGGSNTANQTIQKKIDASEKVLRTRPRDVAALSQVVRGHYQLATSTASAQTSAFTKESLKELLATDAAWKRYVAAAKKPDPSLAGLAVQAYDGLGTLTGDKTAKAQHYSDAAAAQEIVSAARPTAQNYIGLVQFATLAGQTRKAELAGNKAIELAPKAQKKAARQAVTQAKAAGTTQAQGAQGAQPTTAP
jgi:hypothetical protein